MAAALSQLKESYDFLQLQSDKQPEILTGWEENAAQSDLTTGFATLCTTGTKEYSIPPEVLTQLETVRQMVLTSELHKLASFIQALQRTMPQNDGKLIMFLNPLLLAEFVPFCETPQDMPEDNILTSTKRIEMLDSLAVVDGVPVWERMEGERIDFYNLFKLYRDMKYTVTDDGDYFLLTRSMARLATAARIQPQMIYVIAKIYNWSLRTAYYDSYMEMMAYKRRSAKIQLMESDHYKIGRTLMTKAYDYLRTHIEKLTPKDALQMLQLGIQYSRLSVGLQTDKPGSSATAPSSPTLAIFNQTTNNSAEQMLNINAGGNGQPFSSDVERQLHDDLKDEENLLSILHVLQKSGAMDTALRQEVQNTPEMEVVDATVI